MSPSGRRPDRSSDGLSGHRSTGRPGRRSVRSPLPIVGGLLACYLAVPLVAFVVRLAQSDHPGFTQPGLFPALYVSAACATISLALISLFGIPLAYVLARSHGWTGRLVGWLVHLPLALPPVMGGIVLVFLVGPYTSLGRLFGGHLTESMTGVVLAQTFVSAPFLVVTARAAFATVDRSLLDVAATLGHREVSRFLRVAVPAAADGIRAGMLLTWLRAFGEYGATVILAYHPFSLPVYTFNQFSAAGLPTTQAPTALALLAAGVAVAVSRLPLGSLRHAVALRRAGAPAPAVLGGVEAAATRWSVAPVVSAPVRFTVDHRQGDFHLVAAYGTSGGRLAVLGPSGSGKSTLLGALAGVRGGASVELVHGGRTLGHLPPEERGIGYVAQGFGLFPHLRVGRQIRFGEGSSEQRAAEWLARLQLGGLEDRLPHELSGGQRQRVVLAQALARGPALLLLDEPFSALDVPVRQELRHELRRLQRASEVTSVVVTHDPEEAALLADEILVLSDGGVLQAGSVHEVFSSPSSAEVARLLGIPNVAPGTVLGQGMLGVAGGEIPAPVSGLPNQTAVLWAIRPEHARLHREPMTTGLPGRLVDVAELGSAVEYEVQLSDATVIRVRAGEPLGLGIGDRCWVEAPADAVSVWPGVAPGVASEGGGRNEQSAGRVLPQPFG